MTHFFFLARYAMGGTMVELQIHRGTRDKQEGVLGSAYFSVEEWASFRPFIVGGMRAAGYARIPIQMLDQTREQPAN